ncbi:MAG TPA: DUF2252 domain-containing protein [Solirubrobacteraceae bacterium]
MTPSAAAETGAGPRGSGQGRVPHPSVTERAARGKAARASVPRSHHADWEPSPARRAPEDVLLEQAADRVPELVPVRHARMLASPFAFFRGAAALMAGDLADTPHSRLPVQLCGDAHLSNFGGFAAPDRELVFDINDFDETGRGPWEWDVKRLAASIAIAGRELGLSPAVRRDTVQAAVRSYRTAMRRFATMRNLELWYARLDVAHILSHVGDRVSRQERSAFKKRVASARAKDHLRAMSKLTQRVDGAPRIVSRPPLIVPIEELAPATTGEAVEEQVRGLLRTYRRSLPVERRRLLEGYRYRHMARRVGGVGSVGTRTWIVLLTGRDGDDPLFLQVKQAGPSVLERYAGREASRHHGQRVVQGQRLMQVDGDIFLGWLRADWADETPRDYYVRQLWDWKLGAEVELMSPARLSVYGTLCAWTLARAHARSGDRVAIAAYLGSGNAFDRAVAVFAEIYADQNERDHAVLAEAARAGRIAVERGV